MKKVYRLTKNEDFTKVMNFNRLKRSNSYLVFVKPNDINHVRYGISTSKKLGNAVTRVKIRRQVRAYIAEFNKYDIKYDIVIIVKKGYLLKDNLYNKVELFDSINQLITSKGVKPSEKVF